MKVKDLGEFPLIDRVAARVGRARPPVTLGIGDDASLLAVPEGWEVAATTDTLVEGVHFLRGKTPFPDLGFKSLEVNLSDLAAMGARPIQALLTLGLPPDALVEEVDAFLDGFLQAAAESEKALGEPVHLSGGDMVASPGGWVVSVTLLGFVEEGRALRRDGGRAGDLLYLSGPVGESAAGLEILAGRLAPSDPEDSAALVAAHNRPRAELALGRALLGEGLSRCAIDLSDGLLQDLGHVCRAGGLRAEVETDLIPLSGPLLRAAGGDREKALTWALSGGEDYRLLFSIPPDRKGDLLALSARKGFSPVVIGRFAPLSKEAGVPGPPTVRLLKAGNPLPTPEKGGFDHFRRGKSDA